MRSTSAGAILAQGLVVRAHGASVSIGNHSAILENGVVIGTPRHPVWVSQRTVFDHRATIVGNIGDLCEIGNGAILMPGSRLVEGRRASPTAMRASLAGPGRGAGRTRTEVRCGMLAWLRAASWEVVVVGASPVIAQPHAWRSAGSGWRCLPARAVTL